MHHDRLGFGAVGGDIERTEPFRQIEVDLRGAALPFAADGIAQGILELRAIKRTLAFVDASLDAAILSRHLVQHLLQDAFRMVPHRIAADTLFGPRGKFHHHLVEAEILVDRHHQVVD